MSFELIIEFLRSKSLERYTNEILAASRPCIRIYLDEPNAGMIGQSRIGGQPDLPYSMSWPVNPQSGKAYSFVAQINFAELPKSPDNPFPSVGLLYCFLGDHMDSASQILFYSSDEPLVKTARPGETDLEWFDNLNAYTLRFEFGSDIPDWTSNAQDELIEQLQLSGGDILSDIASMLRVGSVGKLLGWARGIGHDITEDAFVVREVNPAWMFDYRKRNQLDKSPAKLWCNLLELDSSDEVNVMFGDVGYLAVLIHENHLRDHDFSKVYVSLESS